MDPSQAPAGTSANMGQKAARPMPIPSFAPRRASTPGSSTAPATAAAATAPTPSVGSSGPAHAGGRATPGMPSTAPASLRPAPVIDLTTSNGATTSRQPSPTLNKTGREVTPTDYSGIVVRNSDRKYLALMNQPDKDGKPNASSWFTLGEFDRVTDALATQDCCSLGMYGEQRKTVKKPETYTVEDVVLAMIKARSYSTSTGNIIKALNVINCIKCALSGGASSTPELLSRAQTMLQDWVQTLVASTKQRQATTEGPSKATPTPAAGPGPASSSAPLPIPNFGRPAVTTAPPATGSSQAAAAAPQPAAGSRPVPVTTSSYPAAGSRPVPVPVAGGSQAAAGSRPAAASGSRPVGGPLPFATRDPLNVLEVLPTDHEGITVRKSDGAYLAVLQMPNEEGQPAGQKITLGEFDKQSDAIHHLDCMSMAVYGKKAKTIRPAKWYTVEEVVRAVIKIREFKDNSRYILPMTLVHAFAKAVDAQAMGTPEGLARSQAILRQWLANVATKATDSGGAANKQAGGSPASVAAQPTKAPAAAAGPSAATFAMAAAAGAGSRSSTPQPGQQRQTRSSAAVAAGAPAQPAGPAAATSHPAVNLAAAAAASRAQAPSPAPVNARPSAAGSQGLNTLPALNLGSDPAPSGPPSTGVSEAWQKIQSQFTLQSNNRKLPASSVPTKVAPKTGPASSAASEAAAQSSGATAAAKAPQELINTLSKLIQEAASANKEKAEKSGGSSSTAAPTPMDPLQLVNKAVALLHDNKQMQAFQPELAAAKANGTLNKLLSQLLLAAAKPAAEAGPEVPLPVGATRQGVGATRPVGVRRVESGTHAGKWEVHHKFYAPKGGYSLTRFGVFDTEEAAIYVHDCAALAVVDSFTYKSPSHYSLAQVLHLVRNVTSAPGFVGADKVAKEAQQQALRSRVRNTSQPPGVMTLGTATVNRPAIILRPQERPLTTTLAAGATPVPAPAPAPAVVPAPGTAQDAVSVQIRVLNPGQASEHVSVLLTVLPAALANALGGRHPTVAAAAPSAPSSSRPQLRYKAAPRQSSAPSPPPNAQALESWQQLKLEDGVQQASRFNGVYASLQDDVRSSVQYAAKVPINNSTWVVSFHYHAVEAARVHDAAAIGLYGRDALAHLNYPVKQYKLSDVEAAMESLAKRYTWVRNKHMAYLYECAAECGITGVPTLLLAPVSLPAQSTASADSGRVTRKRKEPVAGDEGAPAAVSPPAFTTVVLRVDSNDPTGALIGGRQTQKESQAARRTVYSGVYYETMGPMKGTYSAKQSGPTGIKTSANVYVLVGYYRTLEQAARARDMAGIALQANPRLNFPDDPSYTLDKIQQLANRLVEANAKAFAKDIREIVAANIGRWHARQRRLPPTKLVTVSFSLGEQVAVELRPEEEEGPSAHVAVSVQVVPRVLVGLTAVQRFIPSQPTAPPSPLGKRLAAAKIGRPGTPPLTQGVSSTHRLALTQALAATAAANSGGSAPQRDAPAPGQGRKKRKKTTPASALSPAKSSGHRRDASLASGTMDSDEDMSEGGEEAVPEALAPGDLAEIERQDRLWEDERRRKKRAMGVTPTFLYATDDWMGITKEELPGQKARYVAKAQVKDKNNKKVGSIVVGYAEDSESAARMRDLAMLSVGMSDKPRLNLDADEYTLDEVEYLVRALIDEYPALFSLAMLKPALRTAQKHGVRDKSAVKEPKVADEATLSRRASAGVPALAVPDSMSRPSTPGLVPAMQRGGWPGVALVPQTRVKRQRSPEPPVTVRRDYVTARVAVVPAVRCHLLVDSNPSVHRPAVRVVLQLAEGVRLTLSVGPRTSRGKLAVARQEGVLVPDADLDVEELAALGKRQKLGEFDWGKNHLLMLANAAGLTAGQADVEVPELPATEAGPSTALVAVGQKRKWDDYMFDDDDRELARVGISPGLLLDSQLPEDEQTELLTRVFKQWRKEAPAVFARAFMTVAQEMQPPAPQQLPPAALPATRGQAQTIPTSRTQRASNTRAMGPNLLAAPAPSPPAAAPAPSSGPQLHPHHASMMQESKNSPAAKAAAAAAASRPAATAAARASNTGAAAPGPGAQAGGSMVTRKRSRNEAEDEEAPAPAGTAAGPRVQTRPQGAPATAPARGPTSAAGPSGAAAPATGTGARISQAAATMAGGSTQHRVIQSPLVAHSTAPVSASLRPQATQQTGQRVVTSVPLAVQRTQAIKPTTQQPADVITIDSEDEEDATASKAKGRTGAMLQYMQQRQQSSAGDVPQQQAPAHGMSQQQAGGRPGPSGGQPSSQAGQRVVSTAQQAQQRSPPGTGPMRTMVVRQAGQSPPGQRTPTQPTGPRGPVVVKAALNTPISSKVFNATGSSQQGQQAQRQAPAVAMQRMVVQSAAQVVQPVRPMATPVQLVQRTKVVAMPAASMPVASQSMMWQGGKPVMVQMPYGMMQQPSVQYMAAPQGMQGYAQMQGMPQGGVRYVTMQPQQPAQQQPPRKMQRMDNAPNSNRQ